MRRYHFVFLIGILFCLGACATKPTDPLALQQYEANNDPLEPLNRQIFAFNMAADEYVLTPIAKGYRFVMPEPLRQGVLNFFANLEQPVYFANATLQAEGKDMSATFQRFMVNTFWGMFGLFDVASDMEIHKPDNDFGQTLAVWGWHSPGPFLVLPFLGPSNPRDAIGLGVDSFVSPVGYALDEKFWLVYAATGVEMFAKYEDAMDFLHNMMKTSTDTYAMMRTMSQQNRQKKIDESLGIKDEKPSYDFDFDFPEDEDF